MESICINRLYDNYTSYKCDYGNGIYRYAYITYGIGSLIRWVKDSQTIYEVLNYRNANNDFVTKINRKK